MRTIKTLLLLLLLSTLIITTPTSAQDLKSLLLATKSSEVSKAQQTSLTILEGALDKLRTTYKQPETDLSKIYYSWLATYNNHAKQADVIRDRVDEFNDLANDLFKEWKEEAESMSDTSLKEKSLSRLTDSKEKFDEINERLQDHNKGLEKITTHLRDRVLYIKHNLNAESLNALSDQASEIEDDIEELTNEIKESIVEIDKFVVTLG